MTRRERRRTLAALGAGALACVLAPGCGSGAPGASAAAGGTAARIGVDPVPHVRLFEDHSSALIAWREDGEHDRVLVHVDGHADFDWLPDATVARIAAARPDELRALELHPYALDGTTYRRFGIWNFVYPASRMGIVRQLVWVVPDGTLSDAAAIAALVREILIGKIEMLSIDEARSIRLDGHTLRAELLGVPVVICELDDLPSIPEPVLLDIDLDYFTTRSATTQAVAPRPWLSPERLIGVLREKEIRADEVTVSLSTIGGFLPASNRWLGPYVVTRLRDPQHTPTDHDRARMETLMGAGDAASTPDGIEKLRALTRADPEDAAAWHALATALAARGETDAAAEARKRAVTLDPILEHETLFDADASWLDQDFAGALPLYTAYLEAHADGPFGLYALRRRAGCLMRLGQDDEAIRLFREVVRRAPEHADSLLDLGVLLRDRGELEPALELFERARRVIPERSTYAMAAGNTYALMGRLDEAVAALESAVAHRPCWSRARHNLAVALVRAGRLDEAARQAAVALSVDPANPQLRQLAQELARRGARVALGP